jgi:hypothetical protein
MDKELIVVKGKVIEQQRSYRADSGKNIGYEAGAKMVKRHHDQNPDDFLAQFIGKDLLGDILNQPGCIGLRMFYGLNELGLRTLVLVGVDEQGKSITSISQIDIIGHISKKPAIIAGTDKACPPVCPDSGSTFSWWS